MPWQKEFIESQAKNICLMAGRRAGKTHAIKLRIANRALSCPGSRVYYLTPDGALCNEVYRELTDPVACKRRIAKIEKSPVRQIFWRNGSRTFFRMFDRPDKSLGFGFDEVIFDEIQKLASVEGHHAFMRVIRPLILDRSGTLIISGQWRGRGCWWYKWFESQKKKASYKIFSLPTWEGFSFRKGRENHPGIQEFRETMLRVEFDQEIACIPTSSENAVFNVYDIDECMGGDFLEKGIQGHSYGIGADLGRTRDPSAWVVMDSATKQIVHAARRPLGESHETGAVKLLELSRKFNNASVMFDATGGATGGKYEPDAFVKFYRKIIPSCRWIYLPMTIKAAVVQELCLGIERHEIRIPRDARDLLDEMNLYEYKYDGYGYKYRGAEGSHDDLVMALAIAWRLVTHGFTSQITNNAAMQSIQMG